MGFAAEFYAWLLGLLRDFIGHNFEVAATALAPVIIALATCYLMVFGFLLMTGRVQTPLEEFFKRIAVIAVVLGSALHLALYQTVIVEVFFEWPGELAGRFVGTFDAVTVVDRIIFVGADVGELLIKKGGLLDGNFAFYLVGLFVYIAVAGTAIYVLFLLALSRVALSVLLALGPLFLAALFFKATTRFCESWLAQMSNYAFVAILTVLLAALMLHVLSTEALRAVAQGGEIQIADGMRVCLAAGLTCLMLRQVLPLASALASGVALQTQGVLGQALAWSTRGIAQDRNRNAHATTKKTEAKQSRRKNVIRLLDGRGS
jgi:type IV secretion system protein VirB6